LKLRKLNRGLLPGDFTDTKLKRALTNYTRAQTAEGLQVNLIWTYKIETRAEGLQANLIWTYKIETRALPTRAQTVQANLIAYKIETRLLFIKPKRPRVCKQI
jgi:hypothetical protein